MNCTNLSSVYFEGSYPYINLAAFAYVPNVTLYYLPGAIGWQPTMGGRPAVLWNPTFQTTGPTFGVQNNQFGFTVTGTTNIPILLEAATDLVSSSWTPLLNGTLTNGSIYFTDADWTNHQQRFYRIRSP